jgi:integrase
MQNGKIRIFTQKTDAQIYIPVPDQALELVRDADTHFPASDFPDHNTREHAGNPRCSPSQPPCQLSDRTDTVLHVVNNSTFNKNLRAGAKKLGFRRYLHAHLARHTFATSCITFGMPIEIISKMLGHASIQTTLIYANYSNSVIDREMRKFKINVPK